MMKYTSEYELEEVVYLITDIEQLPRIVVGAYFTVNGGLMYKLVSGVSNSDHFECEISRERNILMSIGAEPSEN